MADKLYLAVEEDDTDMKRYKRIHAWGCRDLRDPERIVVEAFDDLAREAVGYGVIDDESELVELRAALAPCAVKLIGGKR